MEPLDRNWQPSPHAYDTPIKDDDHACSARGKPNAVTAASFIADSLGMYVVKDGDGITHTDDVLRALSFYKRNPDSVKTAGARSVASF
jgi:hypothetical protein